MGSRYSVRSICANLKGTAIENFFYIKKQGAESDEVEEMGTTFGQEIGDTFRIRKFQTRAPGGEPVGFINWLRIYMIFVNCNWVSTWRQ
jgi:hypothetical protein